ncbi:MAG: hypothetical protein IPM77_02315 [Crocinitomicaceae bacterium]|nr:hypothetical protein [Crocinitomicaceae bacterium]
MRYLLLITAGLFISIQSSYSQRVSDLGIRFSSAEFNRIIIEYRKPVGENFRFRLGASMGYVYEYPIESIFDANDSLVVIRKKETFGNHYTLRAEITFTRLIQMVSGCSLMKILLPFRMN